MSKNEVLKALVEAGVALAEIVYDGSHDEGFIQSVTCSDAGGKEIDMPEVIRSAIEEVLCDILATERGGWEINDGSSGLVEIDVATGVATFHHTWRIPEDDDFNVSLQEAK